MTAGQSSIDPITESLRIAVVNNFFPPRTGGSAHLSEAIARRLADKGHQVLVITGSYGDAPAYESRPNYRVVRLPSWTLPRMRLAFNFDINLAATPRNLRRMFRLLDDFQPDVVHQHGQFFDLTFLSSWYARRRGIPVVLSVHTRLEHPSPLSNALLALGDRTLVRAFIAISRPYVVVMDRLMARYVTRRYRIPESRMVPIPVGVETERFSAASVNDVRSELGIGTRPLILSIGHVIPVRDRVALVESLPRIRERYPDVVCVVVGRVYHERFLERAAELGVSDSLVVTGPVPKDEIPGFIAAADLEAHDLSGYGLGTASLEVMAAGVPTIAAVEPDNFLDFELTPWENAVLVKPDSPQDIAAAVERLLEDSSLAERVGRGQQALVEERFSMGAVVARHERLFRDLAGSSGAAPSRTGG